MCSHEVWHWHFFSCQVQKCARLSKVFTTTETCIRWRDSKTSWQWRTSSFILLLKQDVSVWRERREISTWPDSYTISVILRSIPILHQITDNWTASSTSSIYEGTRAREYSTRSSTSYAAENCEDRQGQHMQFPLIIQRLRHARTSRKSQNATTERFDRPDKSERWILTRVQLKTSRKVFQRRTSRSLLSGRICERDASIVTIIRDIYSGSMVERAARNNNLIDLWETTLFSPLLAFTDHDICQILIYRYHEVLEVKARESLPRYNRSSTTDQSQRSYSASLSQMKVSHLDLWFALREVQINKIIRLLRSICRSHNSYMMQESLSSLEVNSSN